MYAIVDAVLAAFLASFFWNNDKIIGLAAGWIEFVVFAVLFNAPIDTVAFYVLITVVAYGDVVILKWFAEGDRRVWCQSALSLLTVYCYRRVF